MGKTKTARYDVGEHLRTPDEMAAHLSVMLDKPGADGAAIAGLLGNFARAKGMSQVARESGLSRCSLYKALSGDRNPEFQTIVKVVRALGMELRVKQVGKNPASRSRSAPKGQFNSSPGQRPGKR
jgi:probable addiction module antidote protein